jgi:glycosidase
LNKSGQLLAMVGLSGCCGSATAPLLNDPASTETPIDTPITYALSELVVDSSLPEEELRYSVDVSDPDGLTADISGGTLTLSPSDGWEGVAAVDVTVLDECDQQSTISFDLTVGDGVLGEPQDDPCSTSFHHTPGGAVDAVYVAGDFNDWDPEATPLTNNGDGSYSAWLQLDPGSYGYKFVEVSGSGQGWTCDADGPLRQCDEGYSWSAGCALDDGGCNSMVTVDTCDAPSLTLDSLDIDRQASTIDLSIDWASGSSRAELSTIAITVDGLPISTPAWDTSESLAVRISGLSEGRHTVRVAASDEDGVEAEPLYVPVWTDDRRWDRGLMYFAFVDRFDNGDTSNDEEYGTNIYYGDYLGGDWAGLTQRLDYLDSLGVTVLWLTAPWDNPEGSFGGDCGIEVTGYHGYWPASSGSAGALEEHFGDEASLRGLIDDAHGRGMRVLVDWVGNHVHDEHPLASERPEWFTEQAVCSDANNWNDIPETCWFTPYLPTVRYYDPEPLERFVRDAVDFAKEYEIDGFRVDAVKHMPHSVHFNLDALIEAEIEHSAAGGDEDFYTVGETFSGDRALIASYVNEDELDGQFDFNTYWSILSTIARSEGDVYELEQTFDDSRAAYGGATMSIFLGNHDVERFIAHAAGEVGSLYGDGLCPTGDWRGPDSAPEWDEPYQRLKLAWTWLLTHEGLPLIYYGDEIGIPGYHDPDNRQLMRFDGALSGREAGVLAHVQSLGQARQDYPELLSGERTIWWGDPDPDVLAWARSSDDGESLVIINRSGSERTLDNALSWAGLSPGARFTDILTGESFAASGDALTVVVPAWGSRVLIAE